MKLKIIEQGTQTTATTVELTTAYFVCRCSWNGRKWKFGVKSLTPGYKEAVKQFLRKLRDGKMELAADYQKKVHSLKPVKA